MTPALQVCSQQNWGKSSSQQGQFSMALHTPILVTSPPTADIHASHQHQSGAALEPLVSTGQEEASCKLELTLVAPCRFELRGWQGASDAPEELPEALKSRSLCLLASLDGTFLGTSVEQLRVNSSGEREVLARVSLPQGVLGAPATPISKVVVLELWAAGSLVCSHSAVVLPRGGGSIVAELQGWTGDALEKEAFVGSLVHWMSFQAHRWTFQQQRQQQQQQDMTAAEACRASDVAADSQQLALMANLGRELLDCCLESGMLTVAGARAEGVVCVHT
eukprot:scaffold219058_cov16-Tisochrysis_lutea.AAC.1